jgi:REP element-mobilizing transposase RayT
VLTAPVAVCNRDLLRQIAMEDDLQIIYGKVAMDHISYRVHQNISQIVQWLKGTKSASAVSGVPASQETVAGVASMGAGLFCGYLRQYYRRNDQ